MFVFALELVLFHMASMTLGRLFLADGGVVRQRDWFTLDMCGRNGGESIGSIVICS